MAPVVFVPASVGLALPARIGLAEKDLPILRAAVGARATHLLTGDRPFAHLFGETVAGVAILTPAAYLAAWRRRGPEGG